MSQNWSAIPCWGAGHRAVNLFLASFLTAGMGLSVTGTAAAQGVPTWSVQYEGRVVTRGKDYHIVDLFDVSNAEIAALKAEGTEADRLFFLPVRELATRRGSIFLRRPREIPRFLAGRTLGEYELIGDPQYHVIATRPRESPGICRRRYRQCRFLLRFDRLRQQPVGGRLLRPISRRCGTCARSSLWSQERGGTDPPGGGRVRLLHQRRGAPVWGTERLQERGQTGIQHRVPEAHHGVTLDVHHLQKRGRDG